MALLGNFKVLSVVTLRRLGFGMQREPGVEW
jgi:hypothetical protein